MTENVNHSIQLKINKLRNLPALPEASLKILEAVNDPDIEIEKLVQVLSLSPALVARFLGLANSAYFGQSRQINDLNKAIVNVLGLQLVKGLALGVVLNVQLDLSKCNNFDSHYFWLYSLMMASTAQKLAAANVFEEQTPSMVYTSGLILHIGLLVIAYLFPEELNQLLTAESKSYSELNEALKLKLGLSHYEVGYLLLSKWKLPGFYQTLLHRFEDAELTDNPRQLTNLLRASQHICSGLLENNELEDHQIEMISNQAGLAVGVVSKVCHEMADSKDKIENLAKVLGS